MLDPTAKHPQNRIHIFDPVSLITDNSDRGVCTSLSEAVITRKTPTKSYVDIKEVASDEEVKPNDVRGLTSETNGHENPSYGPNNDINEGLVIRLGVDKGNDSEDEYNVSTPRLWNSLNKSSASPLGSVSPMSPSSRTQAIAKGRRELMEMVKDLPESFYELSLKDIVEHKAEIEVEKGVIIDITEETTTVEASSKPEEVEKAVKKTGKKVKKSESINKMVRSGSVDNGRFLLRTSFFPIFSVCMKSKKNLGGSNRLKIVPMAKTQPGLGGSVTKVGISSESGSSGSSGSSSSGSRSSSNNERHINRFLPNWCLFNGKRITAKK